MKQFDGKQIVLKIMDGINPADVYCTTYQMRNFYRQFADGFFSSLDVMNYIQHHFCVLLAKAGDRVLDVCCGRGLLLPMFRWYRRDIDEYIGVDISETNISEQARRSGVKDIGNIGLDYYPFKITHILKPVEAMAADIPGQVDLIIYTSAIEHMQKDAAIKSLQQCHALLKEDGIFVLSTPNTRSENPYDTQYAAHLYEWSKEEIQEEIERAGFEVKKVFGLVGKVRDFETFLLTQPAEEQTRYRKLKEYLPSAWLMSFSPILFPDAAAEVLFVLKKKQRHLF